MYRKFVLKIKQTTFKNVLRGKLRTLEKEILRKQLPPQSYSRLKFFGRCTKQQTLLTSISCNFQTIHFPEEIHSTELFYFYLKIKSVPI